MKETCYCLLIVFILPHLLDLFLSQCTTYYQEWKRHFALLWSNRMSMTSYFEMGHSLGQSLDPGLKLPSGLPLNFYLNEPGMLFFYYFFYSTRSSLFLKFRVLVWYKSFALLKDHWWSWLSCCLTPIIGSKIYRKRRYYLMWIFCYTASSDHDDLNLLIHKSFPGLFLLLKYIWQQVVVL